MTHSRIEAIRAAERAKRDRRRRLRWTAFDVIVAVVCAFTIGAVMIR